MSNRGFAVAVEDLTVDVFSVTKSAVAVESLTGDPGPAVPPCIPPCSTCSGNCYCCSPCSCTDPV